MRKRRGKREFDSYDFYLCSARLHRAGGFFAGKVLEPLGAITSGSQFLEPDVLRSVVFGVAFCSCVLVTAFWLLKVAFCLLEDLTAFCLKISLRFASRPHCVLLQDIHCVLLEDLTAFCLKTSLRFASRPHCVLLQVITAFCFNITAGKENGLQILQSIDQGPFKLGTTRDTLGTTAERCVLLGPERPHTYDDLNDDEKKRYDADVRATNIVLQGLPKDIYKLINHNIEAKAIWDNVKMLLAGSELTKEDRESQLYDEFKQFRMLLVKLNKGLKETNHKQLYAYLKQHEKHAAQDRLIIERITPSTNDPLAFVSSVQPYYQPSQSQSHQYQSSTTPPQSQNVQSVPYSQFAESSSPDSGYTKTEEILNTLSKQFALLTQSFRATLPQINNQLRTSSNTQNQATIQDGQIVVQNVQGRHNQNQRNFARENSAASFGGMQNRAGNANAVLDEEELLFLAGKQGNTFNADVDNQPVQDLALNEDNIFQVDECDNFDSNVDDEPTAQTIFMANLSSAGSSNLQASLSNASILSEVHTLENTIDHSITNQNEHEIHNEVQQSNVIDSTSVHMGNNNVIPYEQYLTTNNISVVPSCASSAPNNAYVLIDNNVHTPHEPLVTELAIYKEQVAIYEQRAKFELKKKEKRMDDLNGGAQNPFYLKKAKVAQPALYDDLAKRKAEELKANAPPLPVLPPATVYPPNTLVHLVPRTLPTISQVNISLYVITQLFWDFEKTCKKRITPTGITEGEQGFEQTKHCYLTEVIPFFNLLKEHFDKVQKSLVTEVRAMKAVFEEMKAKVDRNAIDQKYGEIERQNLLITNENLIANCNAHDVFYIVTDSTLSASRFHELSTAYNVAMNRVVELESENSRLLRKIKHVDHDTMIKAFSKLEVAHVNLQLKQQHLKKCNNSQIIRSLEMFLKFDVFLNLCDIRHLEYKSLDSQNFQLKQTVTDLQNQLEDFKAENAKIKLHYQELFNSIKVTRAQTTEKAKSLQNEIENLRAQLKGKMPCVTSDVKTPKVSAFEKYAIDVEPIPPRLYKNREVHLYYIKRLKENVETLREIVEDAKVERPLDTSLASTCRYTKHSQELKKRVNFVKPCETSTHNTPPQVEHQKINLTNALGIPSTGIKGASAASRSKPRSNTKKDRTLPARSALKQVEAHSRMNKSNEKQENRVDSSISFKLSLELTGRIFPLGPLVRPPAPTLIVLILWHLTLTHLTTDSMHSGIPTGDRQAQEFHEKLSGLSNSKTIILVQLWVMGIMSLVTVFELPQKAHMLRRGLSCVDLTKGSRGMNLYTISVDDMMRSSPICLLSKASKNKFWLWHRRLNHLNFGTLNDLARKDLVRGLPRLKFEKDHLCSACQLGKSRKATHKP
ncbi:retrovirus-related pol polyprotein from transposon TNT 1-94 [Tanacetum coccineum]